MLDVTIHADTEEWQQVAARLDRASGGGIIRAVEKALRTELEGVRLKIRAHAVKVLPSTGGLGERVSMTDLPITPKVSTYGLRVTVRAMPNAVADPEAINRGRVRHPVFGHGTPVIQIVQDGWFSDPIKTNRDEIEQTIFDAARREIKRLLGD